MNYSIIDNDAFYCDILKKQYNHDTHFVYDNLTHTVNIYLHCLKFWSQFGTLIVSNM